MDQSIIRVIKTNVCTNPVFIISKLLDLKMCKISSLTLNCLIPQIGKYKLMKSTMTETGFMARSARAIWTQSMNNQQPVAIREIEFYLDSDVKMKEL